MKKKKCSTCRKKKFLSEFFKDKSKKDGFCCQCKICQKEYRGQFPWRKSLYSIRQRCENPNNNRYENYGGRGIQCLISKEELEELWFRDDASFMQKPTIDRKENDGHYTFLNCRFIEKSENSAKDKRIPVLQLDLNGHFIREWSCAKEVEKELKIDHSSISRCCNDKQKTAGKWKWKFNKKGEIKL